MKEFPNVKDINAAADRIKPYIHHTPILTSQSINRLLDTTLFFKCENFQKVGAFKARGANNAVFSLSDEKARKGVATHSSGNHAAALSLAAKKRGVPAYIVMPRTAPAIKKRAVESYGGQITFCEPTLQAREETLEEVVNLTGAEFIHPYNDYRIITGQATAFSELCQEVSDLDYVITPVGGGGLLSGTSLSAHYLSPETKVVGAEPIGADDAQRSLKAGKIIPSVNPNTMADGLLTSLGSLTFPIIQKYVDQILTANDDQIIEAMRMIWERMKIIVEPSAAVTLAIILEHTVMFKGKRVGIILSGGNVDLDHLPWNRKWKKQI